MSCIGVLYDSVEKQNPNLNEKVMVDFQINYWKLPKKHWGYTRFLDLGVLLYDAKDVSSIHFYVPFKISEGQLSDLGKLLTDDNLLSILFNEPFKVENDSGIRDYRYASSTGEKKQEFWIACLAPTDFKVHPLEHGSLIEVLFKTKPTVQKGIKNTSEEKKDNYNVYIRIRINKLSDKSFSYIESVSNDFFQSVFTRTEMMNLHINAIGEFNEDDYKDLVSKHSFVAFYKIHFFFIGSSKDETILGTTTYTDNKLLDSDKWIPYVGENNPQKRKCLAYHWKKTGPIESCNIFLRTVYSSTNIWKIFKYSILAIVLGALGSFIASFFTPNYNGYANPDHIFPIVVKKNGAEKNQGNNTSNTTPDCMKQKSNSNANK